MENIYDIIIVGAGSMGSSAAYYASLDNKKILLIDRDNPPHSYGSHHGQTRLIRHAYAEGASYVPLALQAQALWNELQDKTKKPIFLKTGVLSIAHKDSSFINNIISSAKEYHLELDVYDYSKLQSKYPMINVPNDYIGALEVNSGVLFCENAIETYIKLAIENGVDLLPNATVTNIHSNNDLVNVYIDDSIYVSKSVIVCAGAHSSELLNKLDLNLPIQASRATFAWYEADEAVYNEAVFPGFSIETDEGIYYGFPSINQEGLKVGKHYCEPMPIEKMHDFDEKDQKMLSDFIAKYFKGDITFKQGKQCIYTMSEDEAFIIDRHPNHHNIIIAAGFSGHGFKFASAIGLKLYQLTQGLSVKNIEAFKLERFGNN